MSGFILLGLEGVLCDDFADKGPFASHPDPDGILLYHGLSTLFSVVMSSTWPNLDEVKHWLVINGVTLEASKLSSVLCKDRSGSLVQVRERHLLALRGAGSHVSFLIDSVPEVGAMAMKYGVRPLICPRPIYTSFSMRPDAEDNKATWASVEAEQELQKSLQGRDLPSRNTDEEDSSWADRGWSDD